MIENIAFGLIQGLTEFLPVSSSGHLFLFSHVFGIDFSLSSAVWYHFATLIAVLIFLRRDWFTILKGIASFEREYWRCFMIILVAIFPAAVFGFLVREYIATTFSNTLIIAINLAISGTFLFISDYLPKSHKKSAELGDKGFQSISYRQAIIIGLFQAIAVLPGISRSGLTLFGCLLVGIPRDTAFRFSFLLSIPVIFGSGLLELEGFAVSYELLAGFLFAALVGLLALRAIKIVTLSSKLKYFGYYCWIIATVTLIGGML